MSEFGVVADWSSGGTGLKVSIELISWFLINHTFNLKS